MNAAARSGTDQLAIALLYGLILSVTLLQKFALTLGATQIFISLPIILGLAGLGLLSRRLQVDPLQLALLLFMLAVLLLTQLLGGENFSLTSLTSLMLVHIAYAFNLKSTGVGSRVPLLFFQQVCLCLAIIGVVQYGAQFVVGAEYAYFLNTGFPQNFIMQGFNGMNPMGYGSTVYKANGFFLLEPAFLCQFLALAVVIEVTYFRNYLRLAAYLAGIVFTFSGTGLITLLVLGPVYLLHKRHFIVLGVGAILLLTAGLWSPLVGLESTYNRVFEFAHPNSSGYARFLGIFPTIGHHLLSDAGNFLFGRGAGSITAIIGNTGFDYQTHNPSWGKLMFEYGLLGLLAYLAFMVPLFVRAKVSGYVKAALAIQFAFLGEYALAPVVHALILAMLIWPDRNPAAPEGNIS